MIMWKEIEKELKKVENYIQDCSFETACKMLKGWNNDGTLFDFSWATDKVDIIATVNNHDGKPVIEDGSFIEIYDGDELPSAEMSRAEIQEQIERLYE